MERLAGRMTSHTNKVRELVSLPALANKEVAHQVVIGQAATPSLNANVFTGILEGLTGRLGLSPPSATSPLVSAREGISQQWASAVREAILKTEGRVLHARLVMPDILPPGLWLDRDLGLDSGELDVMAPNLMPALLSGLAANIVGLERPTTSPLLASFEVKDSTKGFGGGPPVSGAPGPSHDGGPDIAVSDSVDDVIKYKPYSRETSQQYSPITDVNPEDIAEIIIDDSDDLDKTIEELQSPVTEPTPSKKRGRDEPASSSSPSKKHVPQEPTTATPLEDDLPSGVRLVDILPKRYDTFSSDHPWVHKVRCSLLGLEVGTIPSREDIDSSERFIPRAACKESEPPDVIIEHWLPVLQEEGLLLECPPDQFTTKAGWVPLYTPDSLTKYLPAALSAFSGAAPLSLLAVVPPQHAGNLDKEFLLTNFHRHACLVRQSLNVGGKRKQLAFCPYCGIINRNADTALSHVRKHLDLLFVCGACHVKSYVNGHAVQRHMTYQCVSAMAILAKPKSSRRVDSA